jgi:hypothetical protein
MTDGLLRCGENVMTDGLLRCDENVMATLELIAIDQIFIISTNLLQILI